MPSLASIAGIMAGDRPSSRRLLEQAEAVTAGADDVPAISPSAPLIVYPRLTR